MTGYTRVTLVGSLRRVDVVVPDDEPVGRLLPEALALTEEPSTAPAAERRLVTLDGSLLDADVSLGAAHVPDGSVLRIVGLADAPPPPVVLDVTEEAADDLDDQVWRWGPGPRRWLACAFALAATVAALILAAPHLTARGQLGIVVTAAALVVAGAVVARLWSPPVGTTVVLCGAAAGVFAVLQRDLPAVGTVGAVLGVLAITILALGFGSVLGRGGVVGGVFGLALLGIWVLAVRLLPAVQAAACLAVLTTVLLGLLPRVAAVLAGLTALDDRRARDKSVRRRDVVRSLRATHRGLALTTVAVALSALAAGVWLAGLDNIWARLMAVLLFVVVAVRVRAFPLVGEIVALAIALAGIGGALFVAGLATTPDAWPAAVGLLIGAALIGVLAPLIPLSPQFRARARVIGDRLEVVAVVATIPVLVGAFEVYPRLLASF